MKNMNWQKIKLEKFDMGNDAKIKFAVIGAGHIGDGLIGARGQIHDNCEEHLALLNVSPALYDPFQCPP